MSANSERDPDREDGLDTYRAKRDAGKTPEPFGSSQRGKKGATKTNAARFVVQKHSARRLHYDFRLELDGVLESWAVPRGPSLDPKEKRFAVHVEPHPIEYAEFEGVIPDGNYGAGEVIVWDRGLWVPLEDPITGIRDGKLLFELKGYKLRGVWTLFRTKKRGEKKPGKEWLLMKKPDGFANDDADHEFPEGSILSGLTLDEIRSGAQREREMCEALESAGVPRKKINAAKMKPMLCQPGDEPFSRDGWIYELKYDGYRMIVARQGDDVLLRYRSGIDATAWFPDIEAAVRSLPFDSFILDAEVVVYDDAGRPDFNRLQQRTMLQRTTDIQHAMYRHPASLAVFDLLGFNGYDLRGQALLARKQMLRTMLPAAGPLRYADHIEERGEEFFASVAEMGLEGVVAKKADSLYRGIRSEHWVKLRVDYHANFAIVGYTPPKGRRKGIGAFFLAVRDGDSWEYAGRVGSGLNEDELAYAKEKLDALPAWKPPFKPPAKAGAKWVTPDLVCQVRYREWRRGMQLRFPIFIDFREDVNAEDCVRQANAGDREPPASPDVVDDTESTRQVRFTNLDKVFWPPDEVDDKGFTKGDLIQFYRDISPWMLPYMQDRLVVLTRYPDGIHGKSFFQQNAPDWVPRWVRTETVWSEHAEKERTYFVAEDELTLAYLANLGTIPIHVWHSRIASREFPDWCSVDLDPKGAPFVDVVQCAKAVHELCQQIELPCYAKTSGSTGIHVLIPLGRKYTYVQSRTLAHLLCKVVETRLPDISTTEHAIKAREGKVYLDWGQNGHGRLLVAPFCVRPMPGGTVSTPLKWREVNRKLDLRKFTMRNVVKRMKRLDADPMLPLLTDEPDLLHSLAKLAELVEG